MASIVRQAAHADSRLDRMARPFAEADDGCVAGPNLKIDPAAAARLLRRPGMADQRRADPAAIKTPETKKGAARPPFPFQR